MRFGANKRFMELIKARGWTFQQLADRVALQGGNLSAKTLFQYADGRRTPNVKEQTWIADAFGVLRKDIF